MTAVNGSFLLVIVLTVFLGACQEANGRVIDKSALPELPDNCKSLIGGVCSRELAPGIARSARPIYERGTAFGGVPEFIITWQDGGGGGGGLQAETPSYAPPPQAPPYAAPQEQAVPSYGQSPQGGPSPYQQPQGQPAPQYGQPPQGGPPPYVQPQGQQAPQYGQPTQGGPSPYEQPQGQAAPPYGQPPQGGPPPQEQPSQGAPGGYGEPPFGRYPQEGQSQPYNTGIQYAQQYPPLAPSGQGGYGYGGAVQSQGEPPYQGNYHVPPSAYYQPPYGGQAPPEGPGQIYSQRQIVAPAGLVLPVSLQTAISTQVAKPGDYIQASLSENVSLGGRGYIPAGTQVVGTVSDSEAGRRLSRSGELSLQFNSLRLPNGQQLPISAHLVGDLGKYKNKGSGTNDVYRGEGWGTKIGQTVLRGGGGAGLGAGLGTAVGAIAGGGHGAGMGAWSGAAIGGGIGLADMLLRKGKDVIIPTGTAMQVQLDQEVDMGNGGPPTLGQSYSGNF